MDDVFIFLYMFFIIKFKTFSRFTKVCSEQTSVKVFKLKMYKVFFYLKVKRAGLSVARVGMPRRGSLPDPPSPPFRFSVHLNI